MTHGPPTETYKQRLVQALAVVIARDGFGGAKIQDVVKEARVSLRTFYAEFPNKEACFLELYDQMAEGMLALIRDSTDLSLPWRAAIAQPFEAYLTVLAHEPLLTHAGLIELATLSDHAREARQANLDRFIDLIVDLVEQGRAANPQTPSRALSPLMARAVLGGVTELMVNRVIRGETDQLPDLVETATDMLWSVITNVDAVHDASADAAAKRPKSGVLVADSLPTADVRR